MVSSGLFVIIREGREIPRCLDLFVGLMEGRTIRPGPEGANLPGGSLK